MQSVGPLQLSRAQARAAGEAARVISSCVLAMLEASTAFAKSAAERNVALATTIMSAKSPESIADLQRSFERDARRAAGLMATRIADACAAATKRCEELAVQSMEATTTSTSGAINPENQPVRVPGPHSKEKTSCATNFR